MWVPPKRRTSSFIVPPQGVPEPQYAEIPVNGWQNPALVHQTEHFTMEVDSLPPMSNTNRPSNNLWNSPSAYSHLHATRSQAPQVWVKPVTKYAVVHEDRLTPGRVITACILCIVLIGALTFGLFTMVHDRGSALS